MPKSLNGDLKITITKKFSFEAAHKLINYTGPCKNLHGHTYFLKVTLGGQVDSRTGMVLDYAKVKEVVNQTLIKRFDHSYINKFIKNPTAENIVRWMWEKLAREFKKHSTTLEKLELWETPNSSVVLEKI